MIDLYCGHMRLSFHGATEEVTGSCYLIETERAKVLVDCGMKQGERMCMLRELDSFNFEPAHLDAVVVTHAHFDHTGRLPELIAKGFTGKIFMTPPTKSLTDIILEDSLNIMRENAERCHDPVPYTKEDKDRAMKLMTGVGYHTQIEVAPGIHAMFHDAGHILGSAFITLDIEDSPQPDGQPLRLLFSGDIGNDDVPILPKTERLHRADAVICEATYGDREHDPIGLRGEKLKAFAKKILERHGTLLIPAFSVERTQELLYELDKLVTAGELPKVPIYLDSPLAIRATALYRQYADYLSFPPGQADPDLDFFSFDGLIETMTPEQSKAINTDHRPKIIVAGNGMMSGGRIMHHLRRYLDDKKSGLLVIGFQAPGTLGRQIMNKAEHVKIFGEDVSVQLEIEDINSFSAHGDRKKLRAWLKPEEGRVQKVFLVHGEDQAKESFAKYAAETVDAEFHIPRMHQVFDF